MLFCCGLSTVAQSTLGIRLPVLQGPSFSFLPAIIVLAKTDAWSCANRLHMFHNGTIDFNNVSNSAAVSQIAATGVDAKMQLLQGSLMVAACTQILIGGTGMIGMLSSCIGPLTIAPLMLLLEISIIEVVLEYARKHWASAVLCGMIVLLAFVINSVNIPVPYYTRKSGFTAKKAPIFALFPYLISIVLVWSVCFILTHAGVLSADSPISTHATGGIVSQTSWFLLPYPGQWGWPSFDTGVFLGFFAGIVASIIESVGDYHALARVCQCRPPPPHSINRGILLEGLGCLLCGLVGVGIGVTSYSENVGVVGITKVAARCVMQAAGVVLLLLGVFAKFGALLSSIPQPLMGGILAVGCAQVAGVGLSAIHTADMRLSRNAFVLGFSILVGLVLPEYISDSPVNTGVEHLDSALNTLLQVEMFVAGCTGCILDNILPGATRLQRGLDQHTIHSPLSVLSDDSDAADMVEVDPYTWQCSKADRILRKLSFLPFMPKPGFILG